MRYLREMLKKLVVPGFIVALIVYVISPLWMQPKSNFDLKAFNQLPVLQGGRIKPVDSIARSALLTLRGKQYLLQDGQHVSAQIWLLDTLTRPDIADTYKVFRIDNPSLVALINPESTQEKYFSFNDLKPALEGIQAQGESIDTIPAKNQNRFQKDMLTLRNRVWLYFQLKNTLFVNSLIMADISYYKTIPQTTGPDPQWLEIGEAYRHKNTQLLSAKSEGLHQSLQVQNPSLMRRMHLEVVFNQLEPFYHSLGVYLVVFLLIFGSWLWQSPLLYRLASKGLWVGFIVHTLGILVRMYLQGRPPVTNLYTSAVFVGWVAVLIGLLLERIYKQGLGAMAASVMGFLTLIVAHHLSLQGDTLEMMQAVLDSNFWLSTHVVTVTIGYSATFLAGLLAHVYIFRGVFSRTLNAETKKMLNTMVVGIICFALFFSFTGTVLGGIWADQSWGRFWGWDPKENGALLIVLWNAAILHARLGGIVKERGLMMMAVVGNIVTSFSWFGVNMLGVGLHSYGFMEQAFFWLMIFIFSQLLVLWIATLPLKFWGSHRVPL